MIIRGKLKDVIILPNEGNDNELTQIKRVTDAVEGDPNAQIIIKTQWSRDGDQQICEFKIVGIAKSEAWQ